MLQDTLFEEHMGTALIRAKIRILDALVKDFILKGTSNYVIADLYRKASVSKSSVYRVRKELLERGIIQRSKTKESNGNGRSLYQLGVDKDFVRYLIEYYKKVEDKQLELDLSL